MTYKYARAVVGLIGIALVGVIAVASPKLFSAWYESRAVEKLINTVQRRDLAHPAFYEPLDTIKKIRGGTAAIPFLTEALKDKDPFVRWKATHFLGEIGPPAKECIPALVELLNDANVVSEIPPSPGGSETVQKQAAYALGRIGPDAVPHLIEALSDARPRVREWAAYGLAYAGPAGAASASALRRALEDEHVIVREAAAVALGLVDPDAAGASPPPALLPTR